MAVVPESDVRPAPSVWSAGDVVHTWEELAAEGGAQGPALDPRDVELQELRNKLAAIETDAAAKPSDLNLGTTVPVTTEPVNVTEPAVPGV
jgi:hypothetical protein